MAKLFNAPQSEAEFIARCDAFRVQHQKCNRLLAIRDTLSLLTDGDAQWPPFEYAVKVAKRILPKETHYALSEDAPTYAKAEEIRASRRCDDAFDALNALDDVCVLSEYAPQTDAGKIAGLSMLCEVMGKEGDPDDEYEVGLTRAARIWGGHIAPKVKRAPAKARAPLAAVSAAA